MTATTTATRPTVPAAPALREGTAGATLVDHLARQVARLAAADRGVRDREPGAVRRLRTAARRLRSMLQAFRPVLDRSRTEPVVDGLRELGRALAPARDAEAVAAGIEAELAALPAELRLGPVQAEATRHFAPVQQRARDAALTFLDGAAYADLRRALDELVAHPPLTEAAGAGRLRTRPARRRLRAALDTALATGAPADLHAARRAATRLRYASEVAGRRRKPVTRLQRALSEHDDAFLAQQALRELGATAENGFTFGLLHARAAHRAARVRAELPALAAAAR